MKSAFYFSWSNSIRVFVYVNVYRFAVNVYGLPPNAGGLTGTRSKED